LTTRRSACFRSIFAKQEKVLLDLEARVLGLVIIDELTTAFAWRRR